VTAIFKELKQKRREIVKPILIVGVVLIVLALLVTIGSQKLKVCGLFFLSLESGFRR
jgi:hypothetical protein